MRHLFGARGTDRLYSKDFFRCGGLGGQGWEEIPIGVFVELVFLSVYVCRFIQNFQTEVRGIEVCWLAHTPPNSPHPPPQHSRPLPTLHTPSQLSPPPSNTSHTVSTLPAPFQHFTHPLNSPRPLPTLHTPSQLSPPRTQFTFPFSFVLQFCPVMPRAYQPLLRKTLPVFC